MKNKINKLVYTAVVCGGLMVASPLYSQEAMPASVAATQVPLSLSLQDCLDMARGGNATIKNALLDQQAAGEQRKEALTEYFPKLSANALGFYAFDPVLNITMGEILDNTTGAGKLEGILNGLTGGNFRNMRYQTLDYAYHAGFSVIQPIFAGGRIVNGNRLAGVGVRAASLKSTLAVEEQNELIEAKYWQVISLQEKMKTLNHAQEYADTMYKNVGSAARAGIALDTDLLKVQKERNNLLAKETRLNSGIRVSKMDLLNAIGFPYAMLRSNATAEVPYIDDVQLVDELSELRNPLEYYIDENEAVGNTEEAQLLDLSVQAAKLEKKMEIGKTLPEIGVGVTYGYGKMVGDDRWNGMAFAKVSVPITDWWKASHTARRYDTKVQKAENDRDYLNSQLTLKLHHLWEELNCAWLEMQISEETIDLSQQTYNRTNSEYLAGEATMADLLKASSDLRQAEDAHTDARIAYRLALSKYKNMAGNEP